MVQQNGFGRRRSSSENPAGLKVPVTRERSSESSILSNMIFGTVVALFVFLAGQAYYAEKEHGTLSGLWIGWNLVETDKSSDQGGFKPSSTEKLRPASSFSSRAEFAKSKSFETALLAFKTLPLALQCENAVAVLSIKLVISSVAQKLPHRIIQKLKWDIERRPERYPYSQQDCNDKLPAMMRRLKRRI